MTLKLPVGGGADFKRLSAGTYIAVCNLVADVGLQPGSQSFPKPKRKLYIRFEVPAERVEYEKDGHTVEGPQTIGQFFGASMNGKATLRKETDILDVWFDSACSFAAVMEKREGASVPVDLYLEGSDQHRGWFHSSLLVGVGTRGVAPYKTCLTHGFVVDGKARRCRSRSAISSPFVKC